MYDPITTFHIARRHGDDLVAEAEHRRLARHARRHRGRRARGGDAAGTTSLNRIRPPAPGA